jgi:nitrous oxidase accessory protein NosD
MQPLPALLALLAAPGLVAQTVWNVPDGHFVDPYIAQASPGDILLLGGNHDVFHVDKALTIIGRGTDPLSGSYVSGLTSMHITAPAGARVTLIGFRLVVYSWTG